MSDLTSPQDPVRASRFDHFERTYENYIGNETTPMNLTGYTFTAELYSRKGDKLLTLSESAGIQRPTNYSVVVKLSNAQVEALEADKYYLRLFGTKSGEREEFVCTVITLID